MRAPVLCVWIAGILFAISFVLYKTMHDAAGDRLLFLAYAALALAWAVPNDVAL